MRRWPFAAAGILTLAVVLAAALVGGSPARAPAVTASPTAAAAPTATPTAAPSATSVPGEPVVVWLARDMLPPIAVRAATSPMREVTPEGRIAARLGILSQLQPREVPAGAGNELAGSRTKPTVRQVRVDGDVAHVDWNVPNGDWGVGGTAGQMGLLQQLVYTATEEPGIRRLMLTENGGRPTTPMAGHGPPIDKPIAREDVFGYSFKGSEVSRIAHAGSGQPVRMDRWLLTSGAVEGPAGVLGRLSIEVAEFRPPFEGQGPAPTPAVRPDPALTAELSPVPATCVRPCAGKWRLVVTLESAMGRSTPNPTYLDAFDGPIVGMESAELPSRCPGVGPCTIPVVITLYLEDARPWRVSMGPAEQGRTRIDVDVGGRPRWVSRAIAVDALHADPRTRTVVVQGAARAFEANVSWRKRDATGRLLASGNTTASLGTSAVWGTFRFTVEGEGPASCPRPGSIEVFWISPRDGADQDVVSIPASIC